MILLILSTIIIGTTTILLYQMITLYKHEMKSHGFIKYSYITQLKCNITHPNYFVDNRFCSLQGVSWNVKYHIWTWWNQCHFHIDHVVPQSIIKAKKHVLYPLNKLHYWRLSFLLRILNSKMSNWRTTLTITTLIKFW